MMTPPCEWERFSSTEFERNRENLLKPRIPKKHIVYCIYLLFVVLLVAGLSEVVAKKIWDKKYADWLEKSVHPFGYVDRKNFLERYKPGFKRTVADILRDLEGSGKTIGFHQTKTYVDQFQIALNEVAFEINSLGLKSPEIHLKKRPGSIRILTIGDSCTFGPYIDKLSYPRQLERLLNAGRSKSFEVVNAGHLGYNVESVLIRLEEWLRLKPDTVMIYIGWNRTILRADPKKNDQLYDRFALYRLYYHAFVNRMDREKFNTLFTGRYDMDDPNLRGLEKATFEIDLKYLRKIVSKIRAELPQARIALITLPGLYSPRVRPTGAEIAIGYATAFTANLAAWGILSERYNEVLRQFAREQHLLLLDLAAFAEEHFNPRIDYFVDSVHPSPLGYLEIAEFLAESIKANLSK